MPERTCSIRGCDKPPKSRGWCYKHYERWRKYGDPLVTHLIIRDDEALFWSKVDKNGPVPARRPDLGPCWLWTGTIANSKGYGRFHVNRVGIPAHRYVCELTTGQIPDGCEPDHLCFNTGCVNISHLEIVTQRENTLRSSAPSAVNARKTHCDSRHEFTEANTRWYRGRRICRECARLSMAARNAALKSARRAARQAAAA